MAAKELVREEVFRFGAGKSLFGIFCSPPERSGPGRPVVIFLNAGLVSRVGPNRIYVKAARYLADRGFSSLRFDFAGLGDSPADPAYEGTESLVRNALEAIEYVSRKTGSNTFVLTGICSGAEIAFRAALRDPRVAGVYLVNGTGLDESVVERLYQPAKGRIKRRYYLKSLRNPTRWLKLLRGESRILSKDNLLRLLGALGGGKKKGAPAGQGGGRAAYPPQPLLARGVRVAFLVSEGSVAYDLLRATYLHRIAGGGENLDFFLVKDVDHVFSPAWSHDLLTDRLAQWLAAVREPGINEHSPIYP